MPNANTSLTLNLMNIKTYCQNNLTNIITVFISLAKNNVPLPSFWNGLNEICIEKIHQNNLNKFLGRGT